jgi:hypothetical protein
MSKVPLFLHGRQGSLKKLAEEDSDLFQYPTPQAFPGALVATPAPATPTELARVPSSAL